MTIRPAKPEDLATMEPCAQAFYQTSRFLDGFTIGHFCETWGPLLAGGRAVIFLLEGPAGEILGALGGVAYPDLYSDREIATEMFWFVREGARGKGMDLYRAFERWARERGCGQIRMVHLMDSMPERLAKVYRHRGFTPVEIHYVKEL